MYYPRPNRDELPALYEELDELLEEAEAALRKHFHIAHEDGADIVVFSKTSHNQFLDALWEDSYVLVPFFQKIVGLPDREFERLYGVANIGGLRGRKTDFRGEDRANIFVEAVRELLPGRMYMATPLYTFIKMWENDQRRHHRGKYEETVREHLRKNGFSTFKGNALPGEPDFVVPSTKPYEVMGEVRVIQPRDYRKRFKEFGSEARAAKRNFPDAKFVAVANILPVHFRNEREEMRETVKRRSGPEVDAVIFPDELDRLISLFNEWNVTRNRE